MEQITKKYGRYYYGEEECENADACYRRFRADYHRSIGKAVKLRLNKSGSRKERIHGYGCYFSNPGKVLSCAHWTGRVRYRILGITGISYCRIIGSWDMPELTEEEVDHWLDWLFLAGNKALLLTGKRKGSGRKSKYYNRKYR